MSAEAPSWEFCFDAEPDLSHPELEKDWWESLGSVEHELQQAQQTPQDQKLWAVHWAACGTTFPYSFEEDGTPVLESPSCSEDLTTFASEQALPKCLSSSAFSPLRRRNNLPSFDAQELANGKTLPAFIPQTSESPVESPLVPRGHPVRAAISVALENAKAVRDGRLSHSPCCWKGCRRSGWCNREDRHLGLCNTKCAIPGLSVYPQQELASLDVNLEELGIGDDVELSDSDSKQGSVIGTTAFYDEADDSISGLHRLDSKPVEKQEEVQMQPGSPNSSLNASHCSAMDTSDDVQSPGSCMMERPVLRTPTKPLPPLLAPNSPFVEPCTAPKLFVEEVEMDEAPPMHDSSPNSCSGRSSSSAHFLSVSSGHAGKRRPGRPVKLTAIASEARETAKARRKSHTNGQRPSPVVAPALPGQQCTFCQTHVTPVWRAGPCGPKTLCNACGVRYMKTVKKR